MLLLLLLRIVIVVAIVVAIVLVLVVVVVVVVAITIFFLGLFRCRPWEEPLDDGRGLPHVAAAFTVVSSFIFAFAFAQPNHPARLALSDRGKSSRLLG